MSSDLQRYIEDVGDLACAPLLGRVLGEVQALDAELQPEVGAFGVRFRYRDRLLCEFAVFGALFIARVGAERAVEYRVRGVDTASLALDHVLDEYMALRADPVPR